MILPIYFSPLSQFIRTMREGEWGMELGCDIFDTFGTTILLLGSEDHGTKLHLDWARSKNWAVLVKKV